MKLQTIPASREKPVQDFGNLFPKLGIAIDRVSYKQFGGMKQKTITLPKHPRTAKTETNVPEIKPIYSPKCLLIKISTAALTGASGNLDSDIPPSAFTVQIWVNTKIPEQITTAMIVAIGIVFLGFFIEEDDEIADSIPAKAKRAIEQDLNT